MATRYPLVLNGTTIQELQSADSLTGLTTGSSVLKGNGSGGVSNATSGTDFAPATSATTSQLLAGNGAGGFSNVGVGNGLNLSAGTLSSSSSAKTWTYFTSSGTYTVPAGVTSIRGYACGAGGNGTAGVSNSRGGAGGGGGGFAYGDIAVTPGQSVTVTISSGVATLAIGATTYLTGNKGGDASAGTGGTGGTATKDASVTNGGAYSGGPGGNGHTGTNYWGGSGASAGSPLGNGYNGTATVKCGGAGIGGTSGASANGGGAGGAGGAGGSGGAGGAATGSSGGPSRSFNARFTDPLLVNAVSAGSSVNSATQVNPGAGGLDGLPGGDFGGGGAQGGAGGLMGGGGGGASSGGGAGGLGGGGGGGSASNASYGAGTGGGAFVFIYA